VAGTSRMSSAEAVRPLQSGSSGTAWRTLVANAAEAARGAFDHDGAAVADF
jgi:hypothetical protein